MLTTTYFKTIGSPLVRGFCSSTVIPAKTFSYQNSLPPLPVPSLQETCETYLRTIIPVANEIELNNTRKIVADFCKSGGEGERLQQKLVQRGKSRPNWLEDWWLKYAYLAYPDPIPINSNYYFLFDEDFAKVGTSQSLQAAKYITGALHFKKLLDAEQIPPEKMNKTVPLCMHQYSKIFSTIRIPGEKEDSNITFTPSSKVIVISRKQFYALDVMHNGKQLTTAELEGQLRRILEDSKSSQPPSNGLGVFTSWDRPNWASNREKLIKLSPRNKENLTAIETSLLVLCLDENQPKTVDEAGSLVLGGDANNRWFDKLSQVIVFANGRAGFNGEHSPLDAVSTGSLTEVMLDFAKQDTTVTNAQVSQSLPSPQKFEWKLSPEISKSLAETDVAWKKFNNDLDYTVLHYRDYGSTWIKNVAQLSPDSWAQMSLQLAYWKLHGTSTATYETAQTRQFFHGRTETCRSLSQDSVAFTKAMTSSVPVQTKLALLKKAVESHKKYMSEAVNGKAIDRHLLGLKIIAIEEQSDKKEKKLPEIFNDKVYKESIHWRISTSNISVKSLLAGFGPVYEDGYGICYGTRKDLIQFSIASRHSSPATSSQKMKEAIQQSLQEMKDLFQQNATQAKL